MVSPPLKILDNIFLAAEKAAPYEMCGLLLRNGDFIECENLADDKKNSFKIDSKIVVKYQLNSLIKYIVHSHYMSDCKPSQHDIDCCNAQRIPYMIVSYPQKEVFILEPA